MPSFYDLLAVVGDIIPYYLQKSDNLRLGIAGYRLHPAICWARYHAARRKEFMLSRYSSRGRGEVPEDRDRRIAPYTMYKKLILYWYNYEVGGKRKCSRDASYAENEQEPIVEAFGGKERLKKILRGPPRRCVKIRFS